MATGKPETVCDTPIYDDLLGEVAQPSSCFLEPCWYWQIFAELSKLLGPRTTDGRMTLRMRSVNPKADSIAGVVTYREVDTDLWRALILGL